jgi:hypothetical protein
MNLSRSDQRVKMVDAIMAYTAPDPNRTLHPGWILDFVSIVCGLSMTNRILDFCVFV